MTLKERIETDLVESLKSKNELKSSVLRMLKNALNNKEKDKKEQLTEEEIAEVVSKEIKQRKESIEEYRKGQRPELAEKEEKESKILSKYLPEQLSEQEIKKIVKEAISKTGAGGPQDMGKVMGMVMPQIKGKADGGLVSKIVQEKLQG